MKNDFIWPQSEMIRAFPPTYRNIISVFLFIPIRYKQCVTSYFVLYKEGTLKAVLPFFFFNIK